MTLSEIELLEKAIKYASPLPWELDSWSTELENKVGEYGFVKELDCLSPSGIQHTLDYEGYWHDFRLIVLVTRYLSELLELAKKGLSIC